MVSFTARSIKVPVVYAKRCHTKDRRRCILAI